MKDTNDKNKVKKTFIFQQESWFNWKIITKIEQEEWKELNNKNEWKDIYKQLSVFCFNLKRIEQ